MESSITWTRLRAFPARALFLILAAVAALLLVLRLGHVTLSDGETAQEYNQDIIALAAPNSIISQTFSSRRSGLNTLTFWIGKTSFTNEGSGGLFVALFRDEESTAFFSTRLSSRGPGPVSVSFPAQFDIPGQRYRLELSSWGGEFEILGRAEDAYISGEASYDGSSLNGDIAFRSSYQYNRVSALEDLARLIAQGWLALPLSVMLLAPGWLVLEWSGLRGRFDGSEQVGLALSLSLALIPLLMLWTSITGLRWSGEGVLLGTALVGGGVFFTWVRRPPSLKFSSTGLALLCIFTASLFLRFAMVRDLAAPAWVDSVHHSLIARLIMENGGFPASYAPFFDLTPTHYHPGFHSGLAVFSWLSGLALPEALMVYGQTLNAASVPAVYLLAVTLTRSQKAGLIAALLTGLVTPMPAYYASWGRYTQLAGLLILPAVPAFIRLLFEDRELPWLPGLPWLPSLRLLWPLFPAILASAGLLLVHYRVAAFLALLLVAYVLTSAGRAQVEGREFAARAAAAGAGLLAGSLLLAAPWVLPALTRHILPSLNPAQGQEMQVFGDFAWPYLTAGLGTYALALAGLGLLLALLHQERFSLTILLWVALLFLIANLGAAGLPGGWLVNNTAVEIALFMPVSVLGGYAGACLLEAWHPRLPGYLRSLYKGVLVAALALLAFLGARGLMPILNPVTELFREADRPAIAWIEAHIPKDDTILINPFNWGYGIYAGRDGGYWISPLTGRQTLPPPVLYGMGDPANVNRLTRTAQEAEELGKDPEGLHRLMRSSGIRYVYLGARGGSISASALAGSPLFRQLYSQEGVYIFERVE